VKRYILEKEEEIKKIHCLIVEHGALKEYERNILRFLEKLCFHSQSLLFWCFYHTFLTVFKL